MAEEVIRYGAGGVPYKGGIPTPEQTEVEEPKVEVSVEVTETETEAATVEELEIKK